MGLSLREVGDAFATLPDKRTATKKDWARLSTTWGKQLDQRITDLQNLRGRLSGCIGCGCLSLKNCALYNADDEAADLGSGPRYLLGDSPHHQ
jgi:MerR family redox-sensitive transcriptional activator SoxR